MKEIYLIRHGRQSSKLCNVDVSLDDAGRQQSHLVADRLASYGLEALYASGLKRAQETAQAISETTGLSVRTVEAFHEIEFGELTGLSNEEIESHRKEGGDCDTWWCDPCTVCLSFTYADET